MKKIYWFAVMTIVLIALVIYIALFILKRNKERNKLIDLLLPPTSDRLSTYIALNKFISVEEFFKTMQMKINVYRDQLENANDYLCTGALFQECNRFFNSDKINEYEVKDIDSGSSKNQPVDEYDDCIKNEICIELDFRADNHKKYKMIRFLMQEKLPKKLYFYMFFKLFLICLILNREKFFDIAYYNDLVLQIKNLELTESIIAYDLEEKDTIGDLLDIAQSEFYILEKLVNKKKGK